MLGGTISISASSAPPNGWIIGYDVDGVLKQKDKNGVISLIGGSGSGATGTSGVDGGNSSRWSLINISGGTPTSGGFTIDNSDPSLATIIHINKTNFYNSIVSNWLTNISSYVNSNVVYLQISKVGDPTIFAIYQLTGFGSTQGGNIRSYNLLWISSSGEFSSGDLFSISYVINSTAVGATGPQGVTGPTGSGTSYVYYSENMTSKTATINVTSSDRQSAIQSTTNSFLITHENTTTGVNGLINYSGISNDLFIGIQDSTANVRMYRKYDWNNSIILDEVTSGTVSNDRVSIEHMNTSWSNKYIFNSNTISEFKLDSNVITLNVPGSGSEIYIQNIPTSSVGLSAGAIYTQTAAQLGGSGSAKVICVV